MMFDHRPVVLCGLPSGGFVLEPEGAARPWHVRPAEGVWRVEGPEPGEAWILRRDGCPWGGFVVQAPGGAEELGRTVGLAGLGHRRELRYVLLGDGRLFHVVFHGPRDGRVELTGWETPGPYLVARPEGEGWRIEPTPASGGLEDLRVLSVLFAAEILDSEEPNDPGQAV